MQRNRERDDTLLRFDVEKETREGPRSRSNAPLGAAALHLRFRNRSAIMNVANRSGELHFHARIPGGKAHGGRSENRKNVTLALNSVQDPDAMEACTANAGRFYVTETI